MTFDMDIHVKSERKNDRPLYVVILKRKSTRTNDKYFIVMKKGEHFWNNLFHGIGYWASDIPELDPDLTIFQQFLEEQEYMEVWIPYENIDHVRNLVYIKR